MIDRQVTWRLVAAKFLLKWIWMLISCRIRPCWLVRHLDKRPRKHGGRWYRASPEEGVLLVWSVTVAVQFKPWVGHLFLFSFDRQVVGVTALCPVQLQILVLLIKVIEVIEVRDLRRAICHLGGSAAWSFGLGSDSHLGWCCRAQSDSNGGSWCRSRQLSRLMFLSKAEIQICALPGCLWTREFYDGVQNYMWSR